MNNAAEVSGDTIRCRQVQARKGSKITLKVKSRIVLAKGFIGLVGNGIKVKASL
jgi:hypothetical protein